MRTPDFLKSRSETSTSRWTVAAAGAGGLAVGAAIGAGVVLGVQYVVRGFMGIPEGRATSAYPYGAPLRPEDAAFPTAAGTGPGGEGLGPVAGRPDLPGSQEA